MDIKVPQTFPIAPWNANLNKLFLIALEMINRIQFTKFLDLIYRVSLKEYWVGHLMFLVHNHRFVRWLFIAWQKHYYFLTIQRIWFEKLLKPINIIIHTLWCHQGHSSSVNFLQLLLKSISTFLFCTLLHQFHRYLKF